MIELVGFLKSYTAIDEKFINEYYNFYKLCENDVFRMNLSLVIKYLEIKKKSL